MEGGDVGMTDASLSEIELTGCGSEEEDDDVGGSTMRLKHGDSSSVVECSCDTAVFNWVSFR